MVVNQFTCPTCAARLRTANALQPGKVIRCPRCGTKFPATGAVAQNVVVPQRPHAATQPTVSPGQAREPKVSRQVVASPQLESSERPKVPKDDDNSSQDWWKDLGAPEKPIPEAKRRKGNRALFYGLVVGGVVLLGGVGIVLGLAAKGYFQKEPAAAKASADGTTPNRPETPDNLPSGPDAELPSRKPPDDSSANGHARPALDPPAPPSAQPLAGSNTPAVKPPVGPAATIAILDFRNKGPSVELANLGKALADMLTGDLAQYEGIQVVERGRVDQFLSETTLGQSGLVDEKAAQKAGRELAADYLLTGSFTGSDGKAQVEVSLLKPGNSQALATWTLSAPVAGLLDLERELLPKVLASVAKKSAGRRQPPPARPGPSPTVAVLAFRNLSPTARLQPMEGGFADILQVNLSALENVRLVERDKLHEVLREQKLSLSGLVDARSAVQMGRLLGAERLIYGSFVELGDNLRVEVRLVDTSTASLLRAEAGTGPTAKFADLFEDLAVRLARDLAIQPPADALERVQAASPTRGLEAALHFGEAENAFRQGRFAEAAASYERVLLLEPNSHAAALMRVKSLHFQRDTAKEMEAAQQGLGKPFRPGALHIKQELEGYLVIAYLDAKKHDEFIRLSKKLLGELPPGMQADTLRGYLVTTLVQLKRHDEAKALLEATVNDKKAGHDPPRHARALRELHEFYFRHGPKAADSKGEAAKALEIFDRILETAQKAPDRELNLWAARAGINSIRNLSWRDEKGEFQLFLTIEQREEHLRRLLKAFPNNAELQVRGTYYLAGLVEKQEKWQQTVETYRSYANIWKNSLGENLPCRWDFWRVIPSQPLDARVEAGYRVAKYLEEQLGDRKGAVEEYKNLVRDFGVAHHHGVTVAPILRRLGERLAVPEKAALLIGSGSTGYCAWSNVLQPMGFTVHSCNQYHITTANLAPYSLVILARQGAFSLKPSEVLAFRSYVATGGSLLIVVSPGWSLGQPGVNNPVCSMFGVRADHELTLWAESTEVARHLITEGITHVRAKTSVGLHAAEGKSLIKASDRTLLAAVPYRMGRVVVASLGQWFLPDTDWMGPEWWRLRLGGEIRTAQLPITEFPVEHGANLYQPLLRNAISWLTQPREGRPAGSGLPKEYAAAHMVALEVQLGVSPRSSLVAAMNKLVAAAAGEPWREEALWVAGEAFNEFQWFRRNGQLDYLWPTEGPGDPIPHYYEQLIRLFPKSPLLPYAQWRLAECARFKKINAIVRKTRQRGTGALTTADLIPLYQKVGAAKGSYVWAWTQLRLGMLHIHARNWKEALACLSTVAETMDKGPEKMKALSDAAFCYERLGQPEEAKRYYQTILTLPDVSWVAWSDHDAWAPMGEVGKGYWQSPSHTVARPLLKKLEGTKK